MEGERLKVQDIYTGEITLPEGYEWKNNKNPYVIKKDGVYIVRNIEGTIRIIFNFVNGKINGEVQYVGDQQETYKFKDNKKHGWGFIMIYENYVIIEYYENGKLLRKLVKEDNISHLWKEVNIETNEIIGYYNLDENNRRNGICYCYSHGVINGVFEYKDDKQVRCLKTMENGIMTEFDEDGNEIYKGYFKNNLKEDFPQTDAIDLSAIVKKPPSTVDPSPMIPRPQEAPKKPLILRKQRSFITKLIKIVGSTMIVLSLLLIVLIVLYCSLEMNVVITDTSQLDSIDWRVKTLRIKAILNDQSFTELSLEGLKKLKTIQIDDNCLKSTHSVRLINLPKLETIEVGSSSFALNKQSKGSLVISNCPLLTELTIKEDAFHYFTSIDISKSESLRSIHFGRNSFEELESLVLSGLSQLERIAFGSQALKGNCDASCSVKMTDLPTLRTITAEQNSFRCARIVYFENIPNLFTVNLAGSFIAVDQKYVKNASLLEDLL